MSSKRIKLTPLAKAQKEAELKRDSLLQAAKCSFDAEKNIIDEISQVDEVLVTLKHVVGKKKVFRGPKSGAENQVILKGMPNKSDVTSTTHVVKQTSITSAPCSAYREELVINCKIVTDAVECNPQVIKALNFLINEYASAQEITNICLLKLNVVEKIAVVIANKIGSKNKEWVLKSLIVLNNMIANAVCSAQFELIMGKLPVKILIALIGSTKKEIQEQAMWILDNISQDFGPFRKMLLDNSLLQEISNLLVIKPTNAVAATLALLLSHLTYHEGLKPVTAFCEVIEVLVPRMFNLLKSSTSKAVPLHLCHTLSNLTECDESFGTVICRCDGLVSFLIGLVASESATTADHKVQAASLDILRNLASGSSDKSKLLVSLGILPHLKSLITSKYEWIAGIACATISNLCGDESEVIQAVMDTDIVPALLQLIDNKSTLSDVALYAHYALMFMFHGSTPVQSHVLLAEDGVLQRILALLPQDATDCLDESRYDVFSEVVRCIEAILNKSDTVADFDRVVNVVDSHGGWQRVTVLKECDINCVSNLARSMDLSVLRGSIAKDDEEEKELNSSKADNLK